jgi:triosephosphate isomerase
MRRPFVAGNWKMNGLRSQAESLVAEIVEGSSLLNNVDIVVCPPSILISQVITKVEGTDVELGGQNLAVYQKGAFTGEVSGEMLRDQGCRFVIVGHSERRLLFGESDTVVGEKAALAQSCGLRPIVCVGETLEERETGQAIEVINRQIRTVIDMAGIEVFPDGLVAYEPVWAIGTGKTAKSHQAQEIHSFIRNLLEQEKSGVGAGTRILYGGSVNTDNASELFTEEDIDGGLIGGASLKADDFLSICEVASKLC